MISAVMLHKLRSAFRLSSVEWLLFVQAWVWLLFFDIGLRICPFPSLQALAARLPVHPVAPEQNEGLILAVKTAVDRARYNHLYPMTCLRRSLALQKMLAQGGIVVELKIGIYKEFGTVNAHAWVEYLGIPIGEPERVMGQYMALMPYQKQ